MATEYKQWENAFPYDEPRPAQRQLIETVRKKFQNGYDVVVIEAPTGVGKSGINTTIANLAPGKAFYTTPEKKLRSQLVGDDDVRPYLTDLKGRRDYTCKHRSKQTPACDSCHVKDCQHCTEQSDVERCQNNVSRYCEDCNVNCEDCAINRSDHCSCADYSCAYNVRKHEAFDSQTALVTFSKLMFDAMVSSSPISEQQTKFDDRELLIVDEAHELEPQTASLHLGYTINQNFFKIQSKADAYNLDKLSENQQSDLLNEYDLYYDCYHGEILSLAYNKKTDPTEFEKQQCRELYERVKENLTNVITMLDSLKRQRKRTLSLSGAWTDSDTDTYYAALSHQHSQVKKKRRILSNITSSLEKENQDDNEGAVIALETESVRDSDYDADTDFNWTPVYIGDRLQKDVWSRANKILLSTATVPNRSNPAEWLDRIGLTGDEYKRTVESVASPFPVENRPVYTKNAVTSLNSYNWDKHVSKIQGNIRRLSQRRHRGQKGLVHVSSYSKADDLHDSLSDIAICHQVNDDADDIRYRWQSGDKDVLISPSMRQGVDLPDDKCRWQALAKVPWRPIEGRTKELMHEEGESWYKDCAAREIAQASGRAVRHRDDWAVFHILDGKFHKLRSHFPNWFSEAVINSEDKLDRWLDGR